MIRYQTIGPTLILLVLPLSAAAQPKLLLGNQKNGEQPSRYVKPDRVYAFGNGAVRVSYKMVGNPMARALRWQSNYYLRMEGAQEETLVHQMAGTYTKNVYTILPGGTVVLGNYSTLTFASAEEKDRDERIQIDNRDVEILDVWPGGALLRSRILNEPAPLYFVPFGEKGNKTSLDLDKKKQLTEGADLYNSDQVLRHGNQVLWLKRTDKGGKFTLFVVDLATAQRKSHAFPKSVSGVHSFLGFIAILKDSSTSHVFDTVTGRILGSTERPNPMVAERNGVRYFLFLERVEVPNQRTRYVFRLQSVAPGKLGAKVQTLWEKEISDGRYPQTKVTDKGIEIQEEKQTTLVTLSG
jgi:hypothetical protein